MARDDYFVIVYQLMKYLYECLKRGEKPEVDHLPLTRDGKRGRVKQVTMKAIDVLHKDNMVLLYCGGDDITTDFRYKKISIMNQVFNVLKIGVYNSIGDVKAALIQIDAKKEQQIPLGDIIVVEK